MANGWLEVVKEALKLPALLSDIYGDLLRPGVKQAGKALETVLGLGNTVLWPLALANERARIALKKNLEKYRKQLESIPEAKVIPVAPEVGVPVAEKLCYVMDEELSDLYINLLAKASCIETAKFAHPSFVNIINNLCPDEAILLKELRGGRSLPFLTARLVEKASDSWTVLEDMLTGVEEIITLSYPQNLPAYLSNFEGLGLIEVRRDIFLTRQGVYEQLEELYRPTYEALQFDHVTHVLEFSKGGIDSTKFGQLFLSACLTKLGES